MINVTVVPGDTLSGIAARYGTTWQALYTENETEIGPNPNLINVGERLEIPGGTGTPPPVTTTVLITGSQTTVNEAILTGLRAPITTANMDSLVAWEAHEEPGWSEDSVSHNPLNTTLSMIGAWNINSAGVKQYPTWAEGIQATVNTIKFYPLILSAFRSGNGLIGNTSISDELLLWSGHGYSSV
jgi:murein DD-endopeptidase MepM/ murein hydrolase activator NlpD